MSINKKTRLFSKGKEKIVHPIYLVRFLQINFDLTLSDIAGLDGKKIPEKDPEFIIRLVDFGGIQTIGLEFHGIVYVENLPEYIFNYFVWWVSRYEELKVKTIEEIKKYSLDFINGELIESHEDEVPE